MVGFPTWSYLERIHEAELTVEEIGDHAQRAEISRDGLFHAARYPAIGSVSGSQRVHLQNLSRPCLDLHTKALQDRPFLKHSAGML